MLLNRINDKVIGTNMIWLLMVVLTPFAARTLAPSFGRLRDTASPIVRWWSR